MITAQTHCRGAAQFLLCKNTTSRVGKYCAVHCAYAAWLSGKQVRAVGGVSPYTFVSIFFRRKIAGVLCGFYFMLWDRKSGAEFFYYDTALILLLVCFSSIAFLHRFCRLAPIEALPQTPTGLCPVPTMGFTP